MKKKNKNSFNKSFAIGTYFFYWLLIIFFVFVGWLNAPDWIKPFLLAWIIYKFIHSEFFLGLLNDLGNQK